MNPFALLPALSPCHVCPRACRAITIGLGPPRSAPLLLACDIRRCAPQTRVPALQRLSIRYGVTFRYDRTNWHRAVCVSLLGGHCLGTAARDILVWATRSRGCAVNHGARLLKWEQKSVHERSIATPVGHAAGIAAVQVAGQRDACSRASRRCAPRMGPRLLILGHHYQQDEVIALSDLRGDSYQLSQHGGRQPRLPGDRLLRRALHGRDGRHPRQPARATGRARRPARDGGPARHGRRLLDGRHGRRSTRSKTAGSELGEVIDTDDVTPVTYVNSAASLKAFCGRHGGIVCTSSNAAAVLDWAFARTQPRAVLSRSAPGPQHGLGDGHPPGANAGLGPARRRAGRQHGRGDRRQPRRALARALQRAPDVPARARRSVPPEVPRHQDPGPPRVHDGSGRQGRHHRLDRQDHSRRSSRPRRARTGPSAPSCTWSTG